MRLLQQLFKQFPFPAVKGRMNGQGKYSFRLYAGREIGYQNVMALISGDELQMEIISEMRDDFLFYFIFINRAVICEQG